MKKFFGPFTMLGILLLFDLYIYAAFRTAFAGKPWVKYLYWAVHISIYLSFLLVGYMVETGRMKPGHLTSMIFSIVVALYIPKLFILPGLLVEDLSRLFRWGLNALSGAEVPVDLSRKRFLSQALLGIAALPLGATLYGVLKGKYQYKVRKVQVPIKGLPDAFEGFTITQISDIHIGSFDNYEAVKHGIEMVNAQKSDVIFFTGDLINNYIEEMKGWESLFSSLYAPLGVYSVLGNHDYSDYLPWASREAKAAHLEEVKKMHGTLGWKLLLNDNRIIEREGQKLAVIGVENWGMGGFSKYGKLDEAVRGTEGVPVKLLLSHDPSHWENQVRPTQPDINVMFAGHTHGMQMGVEIGNFKWSPVSLRYKQWAGLYQEGEQYLYVNRGFGFLGFSGRVGILPEITVVELVKA